MSWYRARPAPSSSFHGRRPTRRSRAYPTRRRRRRRPRPRPRPCTATEKKRSRSRSIDTEISIFAPAVHGPKQHRHIGVVLLLVRGILRVYTTIPALGPLGYRRAAAGPGATRARSRSRARAPPLLLLVLVVVLLFRPLCARLSVEYICVFATISPPHGPIELRRLLLERRVLPITTSSLPLSHSLPLILLLFPLCVSFCLALVVLVIVTLAAALAVRRAHQSTVGRGIARR